MTPVSSLPDASIFWKGLCVWIFVTLGTYALARGRFKLPLSDAWMIGLATTIFFWAIECTALWCHERRRRALAVDTEGFTEAQPALPPVPLIAPAPAIAADIVQIAPPLTPAPAGDEEPPLDHFGRTNLGIFSGDIVQISCPNPIQTSQPVFLQRDLFQSELMMGPESQMNLSKVRLVLPDHDPSRLRPLHYREPVTWMHSAYAHNKNYTRFYIKRSTTLVSHQTGPHFREFMLVNPEKPDDQGEVQTHKPVWIMAVGGEGMTDAYLRVREDMRLDDGAGLDASKATPFMLQVRRPAEPGDRHLVIVPQEVLFP